MKKSIATAALFVLTGQACGQYSDDFNRSVLGAAWVANGGTFGNFSILANQGTHTTSSHDAMRRSTASGAYQLSTQTIDLFANPGGPQYVALGSGYGAGNNLFLKLQTNGGSQYNSIGFYSGLNTAGGWAGASPAFTTLASPFTDGRMQVYFTDGGDTANVVIDTNFDGIPDQSYSRSGVRAFMTGSGTGFGIGGWGEARFDNWRIMPAIFPPQATIGQFLAPFGSSSTDTVHQVFRSGLWQTPVRITGVRYASQVLGPWTGNVSVGFGYTSRTPGVAAPTGLDIPAGSDGSPNATGPLYSYFSNPTLAQTLVAGVAPNAENFQLALNATPGFVYFPGMGNLLMQTTSVVGVTTDVAVSRGAAGPDSSMTFATTRFGNGTSTGAALVQFVAMPYTPDVLPTWAHFSTNLFPFAGSPTLMHQVHHAGTIAPLGVGGSGKVAIQGIRFAPTQSVQTVNGHVAVRMGYTTRVPGVAAPAGLDLPSAGGGGGPNASGAMRPIVDRVMNVTYSGGAPENFQLDLHQTPFVYDPAAGNLLIEAETDLASSVFVSRSQGTPEASRTYRSNLGNRSTPDQASRIQFVATPVSADVFPNFTQDGSLGVPFHTGNHVMHQVFSAAQFGVEPVRIDSIAYAAAALGNITSDVTVRMGYTSREPNQSPPVGLSVPDFDGDGAPNASLGPMAVFRSGPLPINVTLVSASNYQIELKGDAPFLYNPAMGNLLVEVVSTASSLVPVFSRLTASSGSSSSVNSSVFGQVTLPMYAPLVKFTYFKDLYPCIADVNGDGAVDLLDFFGFFNCWDISEPCGDVDGVAGVDLGDFFAFLNSFDAGC